MDFRGIFNHLQEDLKKAENVVEPVVEKEIDSVATEGDGKIKRGKEIDSVAVEEAEMVTKKRNRWGTKCRRRNRMHERRRIAKDDAAHFSDLITRLTNERAALTKTMAICEKAEDTAKLESMRKRAHELDYKLRRLSEKVDSNMKYCPGCDQATPHQANGTCVQCGATKEEQAEQEKYPREGGGANNEFNESKEKKADEQEMCRCGKAKVEKGYQQCTACLDKADAEKYRHENESKVSEEIDYDAVEAAIKKAGFGDAAMNNTEDFEKSHKGIKGTSEYISKFKAYMNKQKVGESKVNEDEGISGGATRANDGDRAQDPNFGAPDPVVKPTPELKKEEPIKPGTPEEEEIPPEGEKEYLGNKGGEMYYYFVIVPAEDGTKDLQIQDANDETVFSAKENQIDPSNMQDFLWKGIQELQLSNVATEIVDQYLMPEEAPEDIEKEEGIPETGDEQEQTETEKPKESGVIPSLGAPAFKSHMGESVMASLMEKYGLTEAEVQTKESTMKALMEKFGLVESAVEKLLEKYGLTEAEGPGVRAPKNVEDLEKATGDKPQTADVTPGDAMDSEVPAEAPAPEPGMGAPGAIEPAPEGGEPKAEDMTSPESAQADLRMKYPEEPYTTTALAYADSLIDDPKVYGAVRNLKWQGVYANSETFLKQAKIVGNYNEFSPDIAKRLVDAVGEGAKFRLAREGSVSVYFTIRDPNKKMSLDTLRDLVRADEADATGNAGEARLWWD